MTDILLGLIAFWVACIMYDTLIIRQIMERKEKNEQRNSSR